ncbi:YceD family protein [Chelatococcus reniformis]|uniref:Phosphodiesterase n=1 Tax=Chelatococcus reniformis TaxID=1494448 RepID=A0A916UJ11_9HYPH|nr:DUF177 domain-containing protein [Chelatococcus reniformis]GGC73970.1 phosphodiesterase [Chelatococcus reniformis]
MTGPLSKPPLSRLVDVVDVPPEGLHVAFEATSAERDAMAAAFDLVALPRFVASFDLAGTARRLKVRGHVDADIRQTCVVTLDPFDDQVHEDVDVTFSEDIPPEGGIPQTEDDGTSRREAPDPIIEGRIDLGALAAEFLALGLDPYPRKPGAEFTHDGADGSGTSPFAGLVRLKGSPTEDDV